MLNPVSERNPANMASVLPVQSPAYHHLCITDTAVFDTARIASGARFMKRSSVRLSVCLSCRSTAAAAAGGFAAERPAGRRYR